jgi:hypothetical protein
MPPDRDVMERLVAADPAPDAERLTPDEQREADALLARLLATPVADERRASRSRPRRRLLVAVGAACAAVAALAAINLLGSSAPGGGSVVEKALAAVTRADTIYHVLERQRATGSAYAKGGQTIYTESWRTTDGRLHSKLFAADGPRRGRLLEEGAGRQLPGRETGPALRYVPRENKIYPTGFGPPPDAGEVPELDFFADPGASLRALESRGQLRSEGTTTFAGRRAYRLAAPRTTHWRDFAYEGIEYLVDAETYLPLASRVTVRFDRKTFRLSTRYLVYERLPLDARSRGLLALDRHPGATCADGAGNLRGDRGLGFPNPCPP